MQVFEIHVKSSDTLGGGFVERLLELGALGAKVKPGTFCKLSFPHSAILELEAEEAPMPSASVRVFDGKKKEVFANVLIEQKKQKEKAAEPANFSVEQEEDISHLAVGPTGEPWTKEQLEELEWDIFRKAMKANGISGRDRQKMGKQYLQKVSKEAESQES